ncbi:MAG: hypothetical protein KAI83_17420 [Thiomargarita sp.]|nr:hypothetical protein [Thiomargarita sp.]
MIEQEQSKSQEVEEIQKDEKLVDNVEEKEPNIAGGKESKESKEPTASTSSQTSVCPKVEGDSIETVTTIGHISGNTIIVGQSDNTLKDESTFKDPTKLLPNKPAGIPSFDFPKEIEEHFAELKSNRILLVDCVDENIARAACYELVNSTEENYEKRLLTFESNKLEQPDLHLDVFANEKIGRGEKLVVLVSLKSQKFLDSMFFEESLHADSIKEQLEKNDMMLVCFANSNFIQDIWREKRSYFHFPKWNIPFLFYLLKAYFNDNIAESLEKQILQQRNYGLWDENNSDSEFYGLVYGYLRNGAEQLREEVEKRDPYSEGESVPDFLKKIRTVRPKELIKDDDPITNTVLYVATFFPGLNRRDFDFIVSFLLKGEKTTIEEESTRKTKKGKIKIVRTTKKRNCLKIWEKSQDKILADCHIQVIRSELGSQIVDFSLPYLRGELKKYLEQKSLYINHFEQIRESGLLFNFNVSRNIIDNMINLSVEMAVSDPNYYGEKWLMAIIIGIKQHLNSDSDLEADNEFEALIKSIAIELAKEEKRLQIKPIIIRLSELIREMLNYPQLQEMIKNFLENMMRRKDYAVLLEIVLGIVRQLRFVSQFDGMYWIKQLLERGEPQAKKEAYKTLLEQAKQSGLRVYDLLEKVKTWIPDPNLDYDKYSPSNKYALKFIIDYARDTLSHFNRAHYGVWPSKYPLFANLTEEKELKQIDLLISWMFHPKMQNVLNALDDFIKANKINVNTLLADLIEIWFKVLYGFQTTNLHPEVLAVSDRLLRQIVLNTNRSQQRELVRRWWVRQGFFTEEILKVGIAERTKRQQLTNERKVILELHKNFKALVK